MAPSTPVRRSTRGVPLVAPSTAQYAHAETSTYSWLEPLASTSTLYQVEEGDDLQKRYFQSFMRVSQVKMTRGRKSMAKSTAGEAQIEQLKFRIGEGVLVACHGNSVGVGVLTKLWEELRAENEDAEDDQDGREGPEQEWTKQCEIRWCYRRQDLPTTMNSMQLLDHELLYATSSTKPVASFLPLTSLIHTCSIISSEKFASLYPAFHPSWSTRWKITTDAFSDDGEIESEDDEDELLLKLNAEQKQDREIEQGKVPPAIALATSTSGFNAHKRAIPLVYFCRRAFDKFGKGGEGKSWWYINWEALHERGVRNGNWSVSQDIKVNPARKEGSKIKAKSTPSRTSRRAATDTQREEIGDAADEDSGEETGSDLQDVESVASEDIHDAAASDEDDDQATSGLPTTPSKKRKRTTTSKPKQTPSKRRKGKAGQAVTPSRKAATTPRAKIAKKTQNRPTAVKTITEEIDPHLLPKDPYERALHLLHVGATPDSLPCREDEFLEVLMKVEEGIEDGGGGCLYIAGVPGTGKTATVHAVVKQLTKRAEEGEVAPFSYVEINGLKVPTPQHAYTVLWEAISGQKISSTKMALKGLEEHFSEAGRSSGLSGPRGHTFVVLMDELDQLLTAKQDVVYNFFNWPTLRDSQLYVIAVANRMDLPQHLAAKVKSRLGKPAEPVEATLIPSNSCSPQGLKSLLFQPYDKPSLVEIVQSRLIPHPDSEDEYKVLSKEAIELAAAKMAGTNGDARRVLDACRRAVEVSMESAKNNNVAPKPVTIKDMAAVLKAMTSSPVAMFVKQCSLHQKMMLAAMLRCIRREGLSEISWRSVRADHDNLIRAICDSNEILSDAELGLVFSSLVASHALTCTNERYKAMEDRKVAMGLDGNEVGRVLMGEGERWSQVLAGM
ncbi:hypothetical protein QFC22_000722 [Naganishia vaughanmartiniae]|uniref:Uncharacterized protein n=1 Tax=Naganishia vaughanmartiniae TaxID=1424756 RepID=A0ACC2XKM6_9TREE|nr:hypothetical protein QFC22_000722 [Naganishia vaughanmartiniae]